MHVHTCTQAYPHNDAHVDKHTQAHAHSHKTLPHHIQIQLETVIIFHLRLQVGGGGRHGVGGVEIAVGTVGGGRGVKLGVPKQDHFFSEAIYVDYQLTFNKCSAGSIVCLLNQCMPPPPISLSVTISTDNNIYTTEYFIKP